VGYLKIQWASFYPSVDVCTCTSTPNLIFISCTHCNHYIPHSYPITLYPTINIVLSHYFQHFHIPYQKINKITHTKSLPFIHPIYHKSHTLPLLKNPTIPLKFQHYTTIKLSNHISYALSYVKFYVLFSINYTQYLPTI